MPKNNESTTKFKVDISELVKGMQTAKRQIALANAEFKSATAGMDNWGKSADGVSAKLTQLDKTLNSQKSILSNLEKQYELTAQQMGDDSKEAENLKIKIENQKASIAKTEKEIRNYTKSLEEIKSSSDISSEALDDVSESAEETGDALDDAGKKAEVSTGGFTILKGALADLVADGIRAVIGGLKDLVTESADSFAQFRANTGIGVEAMGEYEDAIKSIYKNNFGESLADVAEKMAKVKEVTGELDASKLEDMTTKAITLEDVFGMDMTETLRGVQSLMDHFGISSEEAFDLMASGAQNGLNYTDELGDNVAEYAGKFAEAGYTTEEYFQLLKNGADGGAYNLDKVNDAINEATTRLGDGTIADGIGSFSQSTQDLFTAWQNGDATQKQVIDSIIKDIQNATTEQDKMNLSALAFGTMAEDGGTKFIESLSSVGDSFTDVKGKADELGDVKYDTPMSALQGLGRTIQVDLLQPLANKLTPVLNDMVSWATSNLPTIESNLEPVIDAVGSLIGWIVDNKDVVLSTLAGIGTGFLVFNVASTIMGVVQAIKAFQLANEGATVAQAIFNGVLKANPIILIVSLIVTLVTALITFIATNEDARAKFVEIWGKIKETAGTVIDAIVGFFTGLWDNIKNIFDTIVNFVKENWQSMLLFLVNPVAGIFKYLYDNFEGFRNVVDTVVSAVKGFFSDLWSNIVSIFSPAVEWFSSLFKSIYNFVKSYIDLNIAIIKGCWTIITSVFGVASSWFKSKVIEPITKFFSNLWNSLKSGATTAWNFIKSVFLVVASWYNNTVIQPVVRFFTGMWDKLKSGASQAWEGIKSVFSKVADFFRSTFEKAWTAVKNVFSTGGKIFDGIKDGIVSAFKSIVNAIIRGINKVVSIPFSGINTALSKIKSIEILGKKPFGGLPSIEIPSIPELYQGGVLKKGQVGYLEGNGDEAVVPLDHNTGWLDEVASRIVAKGGLSGGQAQTVNNNYNYEYNQTNNSPKPLSRLEIYRQTKNQLNFSRMGV